MNAILFADHSRLLARGESLQQPGQGRGADPGANDRRQLSYCLVRVHLGADFDVPAAVGMKGACAGVN
jgi:hypothetical protein